MKKVFFFITFLAFALSGVSQTRIIAHRGYWKADGSAQNSLVSLTKAHEIGAYGSEFDVSITTDGVCIVNHDPTINGIDIETSRYADIRDCKLKNGEPLPTLEQYLKRGSELKGLQLILEIKPHKTQQDEDRCVKEVLRLVKKTKTDGQVEFISFNRHVCESLAKLAKGSRIAYLGGDLAPIDIKKMNLTGIDYSEEAIAAHPEWISQAHQLGLDVNVWTVNDKDHVKTLVAEGVDFITTNIPVEALRVASQSNIIRTDVPVRPEGQQDAIGLTVPKINVVRVGFVGLGMRGPGAVERWCNIPGTQVVALCDVEADRVESAQKILEKNSRPRAAAYSGDTAAYRALCERNDIDVVYICTDWIHHTPIALYAMNHGKNVAIEVPAATSLDEIWQLINTSERTRKHCMMLENCVYDFFEISSLNMAQQGLFGDVLHVEGSYLHNLDDFWGAYWNNWRLDFNHHHRGDVYPTHGIGPDCQVLNIHRGDRLQYLVSVDTKAVNGPVHVKQQTGKDCTDFQNGDETSTLIRTFNGKTILIEHDVMTPRPYSRMFQVVGTEGYASKYPIEQLCFRPAQLKTAGVPDYQKLDEHSAISDVLKDSLLKAYQPKFVKELEQKAKEVGGHGGMDFLMDYRLVYCLHNGLPLDEDVYDMAEWCCLGELSRLSIENNSAPVSVPDFTRGAWRKTHGFQYAY
jgi:glycerophosphoryl diester phosphodiesterase/predicted dehydrogenase